MQKLIQDFHETLPGPFVIRSSTDGVDSTFEVVCASTDQYVISYHYWEGGDYAYMVASAIASALNAARHSGSQASQSIRSGQHVDGNPFDVRGFFGQFVAKIRSLLKPVDTSQTNV